MDLLGFSTDCLGIFQLFNGFSKGFKELSGVFWCFLAKDCLVFSRDFVFLTSSHPEDAVGLTNLDDVMLGVRCFHGLSLTLASPQKDWIKTQQLGKLFEDSS